MITVTDLTKRYARHTAVDHISFEAASGQVVSAQHVSGWFGVADALSTYLTQDAAHMAALEPCLGGTIDDACMSTFLANWRCIW